MSDFPFEFERETNDNSSIFQGLGTALRRYTSNFLPQSSSKQDENQTGFHQQNFQENAPRQNFFIGGAGEQPIPRIDVIDESEQLDPKLKNLALHDQNSEHSQASVRRRYSAIQNGNFKKGRFFD